MILESRALSSYSMHCKFRVLVALQGQKSMKNVSCESKVACKFSEKMSQKALNHVLRPDSDSSRRVDIDRCACHFLAFDF